MGFSKVANSLVPQVSADIETVPSVNEIFGKVSTLLDCPTISLNEYIAVDDDVSTAQILTDKDILEIVQNPNDSTNIDSGNESGNRINDAVPVPSTSEMQKMFKSMRSYLDEWSYE